MKLLSIHYAPTICVQFTAKELDLLSSAAENHYDRSVRRMVDQSSSDGTTNGILTVMRLFPDRTGTTSKDLAFRQVDLMMKALEMEDSGEALNLYRMLARALHLLNENVLHEVTL